MIWPDNVSFEGYSQKVSEWFEQPDHFIGHPPISAQYALDLIFKTLIDDKEHYPYLTTIPESTGQTNSIMLELILQKYSRKYRKYLRKKRKEKKGEEIMAIAMKCDRYRSYLVECVKTAGNMIIDMAEDIVGETDSITNLALEIGFDQENRSIPEITITKMHLPDNETLDRLLDIRVEKLKKEKEI